MNQPRTLVTVAPLFWSKVDRSAGPDACWPWIAARSSRRTTRPGYGELMVARRMWYAHRLAYTLAVGTIPDGMLVLHSCDNGPCCNPRHLRLGTHRENSLEMAEKGRWRNQFGKGHAA